MKSTVTRLETLRAIEDCLSMLERLVEKAGLAWTSQEDCLDQLSNVKCSIMDEIHSELQGAHRDWQVGYGEITLTEEK